MRGSNKLVAGCQSHAFKNASVGDSARGYIFTNHSLPSVCIPVSREVSSRCRWLGLPRCSRLGKTTAGHCEQSIKEKNSTKRVPKHNSTPSVRPAVCPSLVEHHLAACLRSPLSVPEMQFPDLFPLRSFRVAAHRLRRSLREEAMCQPNGLRVLHGSSRSGY